MINNKEYSFSQESRETLLLNYELWFRFVCRLERVLIRNEAAQENLGVIADHTEMFAHDTINEVSEIIQAHPSIFTANTSIAVAKAHRIYVDYIMKVIRESESQSMFVAFPNIVTVISNSLHNMLFILHEIEHLKKNKGNNFISYTNQGELIYKSIGYCPVTTRAIIYKDIFGETEFTIKNYSNHEVDSHTIDNLVNAGFTVVKVIACQHEE